VSWKQWREHREGGGNAPDKVAAARAHPSSGSTCGGGAEAARRCPTVAEALRSRAAPVAGSYSTGGGGEGEAHATCDPRRMEDPTHRGGGGGRSTSAVSRSPGGEVVRRQGTVWTSSVGELGGSSARCGWRRKWRRRGARSAAGSF
jgi:hypothetical protein